MESKGNGTTSNATIGEVQLSSNIKFDMVDDFDFVYFAVTSVAIIIFNITRQTLVCVKQFRPAVYVQHVPPKDRKGSIDMVKYPPELGLTVEFCAGIVDKDKPLEVIAKEEVLEETGYDVPVEKLRKIKVFKSNVGNAVDEIHLFYTEVDDDMKKGKGGGLEEEGEYVEVVELSLEEAHEICEETTTPNNYCGFIYGLLWFFHNKKTDAHSRVTLPTTPTTQTTSSGD